MNIWEIGKWTDSNDTQWISDPTPAAETKGLYVRGMGAKLERFDGGFTTLTSNSATVSGILYLGTSDNGVKYINKSDIQNLNTTHPTVITGSIYLHDFLIPPVITGFDIRYLHCSYPYLSVVTDRGIDVINTEPHSGFIISQLFASDNEAYHSFITSQGYLYYTLSGTADWRINKTTKPPNQLKTLSKSYITGSGILPEGIKLTDIYITEGTSKDKSSNTIFCSTTSGVYIIDEGDDDYYAFNISSSGQYNFNNVWADQDAGINQRNVYFSSVNCLYVLNMNSKNVISRWTNTISGADDRPLGYDYYDGVFYYVVPITEDIVDINKV